MSVQRLWFVRRGNVLKGPFPEPLVARFMVLGRIAEQDEVSLDQQYWRSPRQVPELIDAMHQLVGALPTDDPLWREERLKAAIRWLDDRKSPDPRVHESAGQVAAWTERRSGVERRRSAETVEQHVYRQERATFESWLRSRHETYGWVVVALVLVVIGVGYMMAKAPAVNPVAIGLKIHAAECDHVPRKGIDWGGCTKTGYLLAGADLREAQLVGTQLQGANLRYADLRRANLKGANLTHADLTGARLDGATWTDGRICAAGSVGLCR